MNDNVYLSINNMYGFNNLTNFELKIPNDKHHMLVYGYNAIGKSSLAKSLLNIVNKEKYNKFLQNDNENFYLKFNFDGLNVIYDNFSVIDDVPDDISEKVYIYDKNYTINSLTSSTNNNGEIIIGTRVAEKEELLLQNKMIFEKDDYKKILNSKNLPKTKTNLFNGSKFADFFSTTKNYDLLLKHLNFFVDQDKSIVYEKVGKYSANDFFIERQSLCSDFIKLVSLVDETVIEKLKDICFDSDYKLKDLIDIEFYRDVLIYFEHTGKLDKCPICLSDSFRYDEIVFKIKSAIDSVFSNELYSDIVEFYHNHLESSDLESSDLLFRTNDIINSWLHGEFCSEKFSKLYEDINFLVDNYDLLLYVSSGLDFSKNVDTLNKNKITIDKINQENERIKSDPFAEKCNEMFEILFADNALNVKSHYNPEINELQLDFVYNGEVIEQSKMKEFYCRILSESQKTKVSLAFFFAKVIYESNSLNKKILCIFDDPVDSYDSINKYDICNIISSFIFRTGKFSDLKFELFSITLTHSIDYFRMFISSTLKTNILTKVLTKNGLLDIKSNDLYVFDGDFSIIKRMLTGPNKENDFVKYLGVISVFRELGDISSKVVKNVFTSNGANSLKKFSRLLSNDYIHGLVRSKKNVNDLKTLYENYLECPYLNTNWPLNATLFSEIGNYVSNINRSETLDLVEELFLKNIIALYLRAIYDQILVKIIYDNNINPEKKIIPFDFETIHMNKFTIQSKISFIKENGVTDYNIILDYISDNKLMFNDFAHSANNFLTPLIDVSLDNLFGLFDEIFSIEVSKGVTVGNYLGVE